MALQDGMKQGELQVVQSVVTNESMRRLEMKTVRKIVKQTGMRTQPMAYVDG
jgi:hypothetical protein